MIEKDLEYYVARQNLSKKEGLRTLLYAEGDSEVLCLERILNILNANPNQVAIVCFGGVSGNFLAKISVARKDTNFASVTRCGFLLDADTNPSGRRDLMRDAAVHLGFPAPGQDGFGENEDRKFGAFISPGDGQQGRIENLVLDEIRTTELWPCLDELEKCGRRLQVEADSKSIVQAYISLRSPSLCGVGRAFEAGILDVGHEAYEPVRQFVQRLIG